ncbi:MAG: Methyl-accepting chemotaxis protein II [Candidatus Erwinia impunctatus]|nr:Methyl-accepting chemotaxis protein II [Culicoides impunctatus]
MEKASDNLDLTLRADASRSDEIGITAKAFNHLVATIAKSLSSANASSQSVSTASAQISAGNEDLSSRTEEQAASLEQTAASMSELSETVRQTAENTGLASQLSHTTRQISEQNTEKVQDMLNTMSDIRTSSAKITDIISIIENIAFQTNILALNAAVEAARAGEQGRGFAVVAGEVRNLAQRSATSAHEIRDMIVSSIKFVDTGATQAEDVGNNMSDMNDAIRQVSDLVNEIASAAQEQLSGIEQVHKAVSQMDDVTQQNAALVEEASTASHSLMEQAVALNTLVAGFILHTPSSAAKPQLRSATPPTRQLTSRPALPADVNDNWKSF